MNLTSRYVLILIVFLPLFCACLPREKKHFPVLRTDSTRLTFVINQDTFPHAWTVVPEAKPDRLPVECSQAINQVSFISNRDTLSFSVSLNDTLRFVVLLQDRDSAFTEIVGLPKNVNFSDAYIRAHEGKFEVEIPEVQELANILVAISRIGQLDSNMVDMTTAYHKEVIAHFLPFAAHPVLDEINRNITAVMEQNSYWYYYALKMNACGYQFDDREAIVNKGIIRSMGFQNPPDPLIQLASLMSDFAGKSGFRAFYSAHKPYYDSLIHTYRGLNPIDKMQGWLEKKFGFGYGNYTVLFSPLVGGAHATTRFKDNNFEQTFMFVSRAEFDPAYNRNVNEMLASRVVFTEIDHNFVNPVSDKRLGEIEKAFAVRTKWVRASAGTAIYDSPYKVFNEYMTWSLYSLYCLENFPEQDARQVIGSMEKQMTRSRDFIRFDRFNQHLIRVWRQNPAVGIDRLFDELLMWARRE